MKKRKKNVIYCIAYMVLWVVFRIVMPTRCINKQNLPVSVFIKLLQRIFHVSRITGIYIDPSIMKSLSNIPGRKTLIQ